VFNYIYLVALKLIVDCKKRDIVIGSMLKFPCIFISLRSLDLLRLL